VSPLVRFLLPLLSLCHYYLKVESRMKNVTETLGLWSRAPEFLLTAANRQGQFSLAALRAHGSVIIEFLRGTW
jgi:hypothetical protein